MLILEFATSTNRIIVFLKREKHSYTVATFLWSQIQRKQACHYPHQSKRLRFMDKVYPYMNSSDQKTDTQEIACLKKKLLSLILEVNPLTPSAMPFGNRKNILEDLLNSVLSQFKKNITPLET